MKKWYFGMTLFLFIVLNLSLVSATYDCNDPSFQNTNHYELNCSVEFGDPDHDALTYNYTWYKVEDTDYSGSQYQEDADEIYYDASEWDSDDEAVLNDSLWDSDGGDVDYAVFGHDAYYYVNYTKPIGADSLQSTWKIQVYDEDVRDLNIHQDCWDYHQDKLVLRIRSCLYSSSNCFGTGKYYLVTFDCADGDNAWEELHNDSDDPLVYEEAMNWEINKEKGSLQQISKETKICISPDDESQYMCEVNANDPFEKSRPYRKSFTLSKDRFYVPYGSIEPIITKIGGYSGRNAIPLNVEMNPHQDFTIEIDAQCMYGDCGTLDLTSDYNTSFLSLVYANYLTETFVIPHNNAGQTSYDAEISSDQSSVFKESTKSYNIINKGDFSHVDYYGDFDVGVTLAHTQTDLEEIQTTAISMDMNDQNITFLTQLKVGDRYEINPPYTMDVSGKVQILSSDESILAPIAGTPYSFEPLSPGCVDVDITVDYNLLVSGMDILEKKNTETYEVCILNVQCPDSIIVSPTDYHNISYRNVDDDLPYPVQVVAKYGNTYSTLRNDADGLNYEINYSKFIEYLTEAPNNLDLAEANARKNTFENYIDMERDAVNDLYFNIISTSSFDQAQFTDLFLGTQNNFTGLPINFTYSPLGCSDYSSIFYANFVNESTITPDCDYYIHDPSHTHYWKSEINSIEVRKICSGIDTRVDSERIDLEVVSGNPSGITFKENNDFTCTNQNNDGSGTICYKVDAIGIYQIKVSIDGNDYGLFYYVGTDCAFENDLSIQDTDFIANKDRRTLMVGDDFVVDDLMLRCKNAANCAQNPLDITSTYYANTYLNALNGHITFTKNNADQTIVGTVNDCAEKSGNPYTDTVEVTFQPLSISFCEADITTQDDFYLPEANKRVNHCSNFDNDVLEGFIKNRISLLNSRYDQNTYEIESYNKVKTILDDSDFIEDLYYRVYLIGWVAELYKIMEEETDDLDIFESSENGYYYENLMHDYPGDFGNNENLQDIYGEEDSTYFNEIIPDVVRNNPELIEINNNSLPFEANKFSSFYPIVKSEYYTSYGTDNNYEIIVQSENELFYSQYEVINKYFFLFEDFLSSSCEFDSDCISILNQIIFDPGTYIDDDEIIFCESEIDLQDMACCDDADDDVFQEKCYDLGTRLDLDLDLIDEVAG